MDKIHSGLLRKFHTLCSRLGLNETEKRAIVESRGVESSSDIDTHDLIDICASLSRQAGENKGDEMDKLRKRAMAAVGGYLRLTKQDSSVDIVKSIACRATGHTNFNKIPAERLRNIYYTFSNKQKDIRSVDSIATEMAIQGMLSNTKITAQA
ncbi:MAG: hypothetical protein RR221_07570 [Alistipes sp.]